MKKVCLQNIKSKLIRYPLVILGTIVFVPFLFFIIVVMDFVKASCTFIEEFINDMEEDFYPIFKAIKSGWRGKDEEEIQ